MGEAVQVERNQEGDEYLCDGCEVVALLQQQHKQQHGGEYLEDVEPEVAAVDAQVHQVVVAVLALHQ